MRCSSCNHPRTHVVDSRESTSGLTVRRRRECEKCLHRFSTGERLEILDMIVVKRDGSRVPYTRDNVESGIRRALEKRHYTTRKFNRLLVLIEHDIQRCRAREISSQEIGKIVMKHLRKFDRVGFVRFASVYLNFSDVERFAQAVSDIRSRKKIIS